MVARVYGTQDAFFACLIVDYDERIDGCLFARDSGYWHVSDADRQHM